MKHLLYEDNRVKVSDEWAGLHGHRLLRARLLGLAFSDLKALPYDHQANQKLYLRSDRVDGVDGYIFYRRTPSAENETLVLGIGLGIPDRTIHVEMTRRLIASSGM